MTRFYGEITGQFGEFWRKDAEKRVAEMAESFSRGEIIIEDDGAAKWASNGRYIPEDCAEMLFFSDVDFDFDAVKATERKRDSQTREAIENYKAFHREPTVEEMAEMAVTFKGQKVVDLISGETYQF